MTLLTEKVEVKWHGSNRKHYEALGYKWTKRGDSFKVPVEHLPSGSGVKVEVQCNYCRKEYSPSWKNFLTGRRRARELKKDACGDGVCRALKRSEMKVLNGGKTVSNIPKLLEEWHESNEESPSRVLVNSHKKFSWECSVCGGEWEATPNNRYSNKSGCPHCIGRYSEPLSVSHPELVVEWSDKNDLQPSEITVGSRKAIIWECSTCNHEWKARPTGRTRGGGCPHCAGFYSEPLSVTHPDLVEEWSVKNELRPDEITAGSVKRIIWECKTCSNTWTAPIYSRTHGRGCPSCNESKGEKLVAKILDELNVCYAREYSFDKLRGSGGGSLRYDFAILHEGEPIALVEYDGEQHFKAIEHFGGEARLKRQQRHDRLKDEYAHNNDIPLLRIRYDQSDEETIKKVSEFVTNWKEFERVV